MKFMRFLKKSSLSRNKRKERTISAFYLAPSFIGVMTFFFVPFLVVIYYSMINNPIGKEFVGFENFISVFNNKAFRMALVNTGKFTFISVPLVVILSLLAAIAIDNSIPGKSKIRSALLSPMMVPIASVILIWQVLFDYNGVVNEVMAKYGMEPIDFFKSEKALLVVVILFVWKNLGYNMILFMAALSAIPKELIEVALLDSKSRFKIFWNIKIRYLSSTILFVTILSIINSFKVFREVYLLSGDYPYDLYMMQHYMNNMFKSLDYQKLSAAAIMMAGVMLVLVLLLFIIENFVGKDLEE